MSIAELFYRAVQLLRSKYEQIFCVGRKLPRRKYTNLINSFDYDQNSELRFSEVLKIFGKSLDYSTEEIDWHKDIYSGKRFPMTFSKSINIRNKSDLSAKNVWEVNRLQFLLPVAMNYKHSGDKKFLEQFMKILESWIDHNPYLLGINWFSNIEVNIRLMVWHYCWHLLGAENLLESNKKFNEFVESKWIPCIYQHCKYSYINPSKFSSSNNHLISEYAGLFVASSLWGFRESAKWNRYAKRGLEKEILRQHSKNGINKEEAAEYIQFITDFFLIAYLVGENTENSFSEAYKEMLKNIFYYIYHFLDAKGNFPQYGDEDDGKVLIMDPEEYFNNFQSLLTSGAIIFNDKILKSKSHGMDLKNQVLFGSGSELDFMKIPQVLMVNNSKFYKDEGHFYLRGKSNANEIYIHFDAAPLGFLSIAAHGHADALSFILSINGQPFFTDSGTYTYHTEVEWRNYFIGTIAHNTLRINKTNQATIAGPTLWRNHFTSKVIKSISTSAYDRIKAEHNGYRSQGIMHTRELFFDKKESILRITDEIKSTHLEPYLVEIPFHLHPDLHAELNEINKDQVIIRNKINGQEVELQTNSLLNIKIIKGQIEPEIIGWYSKSFMKKEASYTILCSIETSGNQNFETIISIK